MRRLIPVLLAALAVAAPGPARSAGPDLAQHVKADSSRFLPRWMSARLEAGLSWMQSPREVRDRYVAGVAFGGSLNAAVLPRLRLSARLEYLDLPNGEVGSLGGYQTIDGQVYTSTGVGYNAFNGGRSFEALGVLSARVWRNLWVEGGAGHGHFDSGYPPIQFIDGVTGEYVDIPGRSGWGQAYTAGLAYDFTVRQRERLYVTARWTRLERGGVSLDFVPLGIGYRFE